MATVTIGANGSISLPDELRERYGLGADTPVRIIETRSGLLLIPMTEAPMSEALFEELEEWQALGMEAAEALPFEHGTP
jgi:bifunctional DNA-binding transcriptional regulator/antitoxin component of YhaV-PrlF toxin-antitoxin module